MAALKMAAAFKFYVIANIVNKIIANIVNKIIAKDKLNKSSQQRVLQCVFFIELIIHANNTYILPRKNSTC